MIVRAAKQTDLDAILHLAKQTGAGFTSLIADKKYLLDKVLFSQHCFLHKPQPALYFFVLEEKNQVIGCAAIKVHAGDQEPFYSYKISTIHHVCHEKKLSFFQQILSMVNDFDEAAELSTLFILPEYRNKINGHLLSYARLLYIALHQENIPQRIIADVRGVCDENGSSPFWEAVGKNFYGMDFVTADQLTGLGDKQFIRDLKPELPLYVNLLPETAQAVIGIAHPASLPALNLLAKQGFTYQDYVDIFDAGPTLCAQQEQIILLNQAKCYQLSTINQGDNSDNWYMIASTTEPFIATAAQLTLLDKANVMLPASLVKMLNLSINDTVIIAPLFVSEAT